MPSLSDVGQSIFEQTQLDDQPLIIRRLNMARGRNSQDQPSAILEDEVSVLQNADISSKGVSQTRQGFTLIANIDDTSNPVLGLGRFYPEGGTKRLLKAVGSSIKEWQGSGNWTSLTLPFTPSAGLRTRFVVAGKRVFILNGVDNVMSYDGSSVIDEGNTNSDPPRSRFGIYHQNRLILAGNQTNRSYFWFSNVLDPQTFDRTTNVHKVSDKDNDELTALVNLSLTTTPGFLAFKNRSVHYVDTSNINPANWSIIPIDVAHGCVGDRAAVPVGSSILGGDVVFLSKEGKKYRLRSLRRSVSDSLETGGVLSNAIEDILSDVNHANMHKSVVFYFDEKVLVAFPSAASTEPDTIAVLDLRATDLSKSSYKWTIWKWPVKINDFEIFEESSVEYLYFGRGSTNSSVYRMFSGTSDSGTSIPFIEEGRREDFGLPELLKNGEHVEVYFLSTDDSLAWVYVSLDGGPYTSLGSVSLVPSSSNLPINLPFNLSGPGKIMKKFPLDNLGPFREIQVKVTHDTLNKRVEYLGYTLAAFPIPLELG